MPFFPPINQRHFVRTFSGSPWHLLSLHFREALFHIFLQMLCKTVNKVNTGRRYWWVALQLHPWNKGSSPSPFPSDPPHCLFLQSSTHILPNLTNTAGSKASREQFSYPSVQEDDSQAVKPEQELGLLKWQHEQCSYNPWQHRYFLFKLQ